MKILPLAAELNAILERECPAILEMLSPLGKRLYMPKGIISQSSEAKAKAHRFNATIGIATESGEPMHLPSLKRLFQLKASEVFPYAPVAGTPALRKAWREKQLRENPAMREKHISLPVVTSALTHGLALTADLFAAPGDVVVLPDQFWGNYRLTFEVRQEAVIETYPLLDGERFHVAALKAKLADVAKRRSKAIVVLNFPNNPTGFTPSAEDGRALAEAIVAAAEKGLRQVVICDDAYFGLFYDENCLEESIFGFLANRHPNVLAIKLDGATKELFAWGFRVGCIVYGAGGEGDLAKVYEALEKKTMGAIRGAMSNSPHPTQSAVLAALATPSVEEERRAKREILRARAQRTREVVYEERYRDAWTPYPFNSGYFMCIRMHDVDAEALRVHLLERYGVGVIASGGADIRVAFSCLEVDAIPEVFEAIHAAWTDLRSGKAT